MTECWQIYKRKEHKKKRISENKDQERIKTYTG